MSNTQVWAVVPAAGIGSRMLASRPKQYLALGDKTVIEHTLSCLASHPKIEAIVVAVAEDDRWWAELSLDLDCTLYVVTGGVERADSVLQALVEVAKQTDTNPWVLVHDAARPCLRHRDIDHMLEQLSVHPVGGILGVPITETVKRADAQGTITDTVSRQGLWRAATPQMFHLNQLKTALEEAHQQNKQVTDDASAMALAGFQSMMVEGHADNIKITTPYDLTLANVFLKQQGRA